MKAKVLRIATMNLGLVCLCATPGLVTYAHAAGVQQPAQQAPTPGDNKTKHQPTDSQTPPDSTKPTTDTTTQPTTDTTAQPTTSQNGTDTTTDTTLKTPSSPTAQQTDSDATKTQSADQQTAPDNTKMNKEAKNGAVTADKQPQSRDDLALAKKIRRAITSDSSLSTYAHNVKVVVRGGTVTLKGPVRSEDEKTAVAAKASEIAGADKVQNELTVKS
ncbi:MAG: hypothetical protein NVS9B4_05280 [Candidatus Acidiferrum sp.]